MRFKITLLPFLLLAIGGTSPLCGQEAEPRLPNGIQEKDAEVVHELVNLLSAEFPEAEIRIRRLNSGVVLSGSVSDPTSSSSIVRMAEDYYPKVINNLRVRESANATENIDLKIVKLQHLAAAQAVATINALYSELLATGFKVDSNPEQNLLLMRGRTRDVREIEALLAELDQPVERPANAAWTSVAASPAEPLSSMDSSFGALEMTTHGQRLEELASRFRLLKQQSADGVEGASDEQVAATRRQLELAVKEFVVHREQRQQRQLQQLQHRLAALSKQIDSRHANRQQIVAALINDLLSGTPLPRWEGARPGAEPRPGSVLSAEDEPSAAIPEMREAIQLSTRLQADKNSLHEAERMFERGYITALELSNKKANLESAKMQLEAIATSKRLQFEKLQLELAQAETELEYASEEYTQAEQAQQKLAGSITKSELRLLALANRRAQFNLQRVRLEWQAAKAEFAWIDKMLAK